MKKFLHNTLCTLASLKLAVVLITILCVLMALATGLEKIHGATFAQWTIYDSPVFSALFVLLFANILISALLRLPFRKKLTGFYLIHLGILVLLAGALTSKMFGREGSVELTPNEPTTTFTTQTPTLTVYFLNGQDDDVIQIKKPLPKKVSGLRSSKSNTIRVEDFLITVADFIPFSDPHNSKLIQLPTGDDATVMSAHILVTRVSDGAVLEDTWFTEAHPAHVTLNITEMCVLVLGHADEELPFTLTLKTFEVGTDPETGAPSSYVSTLSVMNDEGQHEATISMNRPLNIEGYRFFQSSYFGLDDGSLGSLLTVNKDPGRLMKYLGSGFLVLGGFVHLLFGKKS